MNPSSADRADSGVSRKIVPIELLLLWFRPGSWSFFGISLHGWQNRRGSKLRDNLNNFQGALVSVPPDPVSTFNSQAPEVLTPHDAHVLGAVLTHFFLANSHLLKYFNGLFFGAHAPKP
ncbi:MAG TPA: hypothetical protein VFE51_05280 [Verrucomicrobiae bacterium]|nr:hypothetical protein [Verrucomicrobiae bacterium]